MIKLYSHHPKEWTVCQKTVYICPLGRLTRWNWTIFLHNAPTCASLSRVCVVRQQRAHIWHAGIPRCISQAGELQWRSKGRWASMLHKHPFLSLIPTSVPFTECASRFLSVCPVNTLMHTHTGLLVFCSFVSIERRHLAGHRENTPERVLRIHWNRWAIFCPSLERVCFSPTHLVHTDSLMFCCFSLDWELSETF